MNIISSVAENDTLSATFTTPPTNALTSLQIEVSETDVRAKEFSCKLIFKNDSEDVIDISSISQRVSSGIKIQESDDSSNTDLREEYESLRDNIKVLLHAVSSEKSNDYLRAYVHQFVEAFRKELSLRRISDLYLRIFFGNMRQHANELRRTFRATEFPVSSSVDARNIYGQLIIDNERSPLSSIIEAKISRMEKIESKDPDFFINAESIARVFPGEVFERVYILQCKRNFASIVSYTIGFDIRTSRRNLQSGPSERSADRITSKSVSISVTPSPITLSIYAIVFSILGVFLALLPDIKNDNELIEILNFQIGKQIVIAAVLAIIVYNTFELTELKDKFKYVSWRSAMLVGTLCGLMSERMLQALKALVG